LGGVLGGVLIFSGVGVLAVVEGCVFFGFFILIKNLLATWRCTARGSRRMVTRRTSLATSTRKRSMSSGDSGLIGSIPLGEGIIKSW